LLTIHANLKFPALKERYICWQVPQHERDVMIYPVIVQPSAGNRLTLPDQPVNPTFFFYPGMDSGASQKTVPLPKEE